MTYWKGRNVAVTGGASFIGSHLVDRLRELGAEVSVIDNLSSGTLENLSQSPGVDFLNLDLERSRSSAIVSALRGKEIVFHLAAAHGGRGYIDSHPADVCSNFSIDYRVFNSCLHAGVEKVVFASSACVYPPSLQDGSKSDYLLREEDSDTSELSQFLCADLEYGWAKLMGEMQLRAFGKQYGLKSAVLRFVTAYGERENETHAIIALIHKAHERMDPLVVWGNGEQCRDFTYVSDIVDGTVLAGERISDGTPINLGTGKRIRLNDVAEIIANLVGYSPRLVFDTGKPTGVANRSLDNRRALDLLGWRPKVTLVEGLERTVAWYVSTHSRTGWVNEKSLLERSRSSRRRDSAVRPQVISQSTSHSAGRHPNKVFSIISQPRVKNRN